MSRPADVEHLFTEAGQAGGPTALVCAAGALTSVPFADTTAQIWTETLAVNLTGTFLCCRAAFTAMTEAGEGRIVTIASLSGVYATEKFPGLAAYNASKFGVVGLTEAIAVEGKKHGISAICVSPGAVDTEMLRRANPDLRPGLTPADVADLILALLDNPLVAGERSQHPVVLERLTPARYELAGSDHRSVRSSASRSRAGRARPATSRPAAAISPSWSSSGSPPRSRPTAAWTRPPSR